MKYVVRASIKAERHLRSFKARQQRIIQTGIEKLITEPTNLSKSVKKLRPNPIAQYEIRIGEFRALYNVDEAAKVVTVLLIGEKRGNELFVEGKVFDAHKSDSD